MELGLVCDCAPDTWRRRDTLDGSVRLCGVITFGILIALHKTAVVPAVLLGQVADPAVGTLMRGITIDGFKSQIVAGNFGELPDISRWFTAGHQKEDAAARAGQSSTTQAQALFDVNVFGVFHVTRAVLPPMRRQGKDRIVNVSSVQGFIPALYFALYSSTKHAVEGYSESLDHELRPFGIRVSLIEPWIHDVC